MGERDTAIDYYDLDQNELWVRGRKLFELASACDYPAVAALAIIGFVPEGLSSINQAARAVAQKMVDSNPFPRESKTREGAALTASIMQDVLYLPDSRENAFPDLIEDDVWHALVLQQAVTGLVVRRLWSDRAEIPSSTRELIAAFAGENERGNATPDQLMVCLSGGFGVVAPTTALARFSASTRAPMAWAVAASGMGCGPAHLGACSLAMDRLGHALRTSGPGMLDAYCARRPFPGFGHPIMPSDPRTDYLFTQFADQSEIATARRLAETVTAKYGLHPNIDFAAAAILLGFRVAPARGSLFFWLSRLPVILAHICAKRREPAFGLRPAEAREKYRNIPSSWL